MLPDKATLHVMGIEDGEYKVSENLYKVAQGFMYAYKVAQGRMLSSVQGRTACAGDRGGGVQGVHGVVRRSADYGTGLFVYRCIQSYMYLNMLSLSHTHTHTHTHSISSARRSTTGG